MKSISSSAQDIVAMTVQAIANGDPRTLRALSVACIFRLAQNLDAKDKEGESFSMKITDLAYDALEACMHLDGGAENPYDGKDQA